MKVNTIQQYYVKQFLEVEELKLTLMDRYTIRVKDSNDDEMEFWWDIEECKVKYRDI